MLLKKIWVVYFFSPQKFGSENGLIRFACVELLFCLFSANCCFEQQQHRVFGGGGGWGGVVVNIIVDLREHLVSQYC